MNLTEFSKHCANRLPDGTCCLLVKNPRNPDVALPKGVDPSMLSEEHEQTVFGKDGKKHFIYLCTVCRKQPVACKNDKCTTCNPPYFVMDDTCLIDRDLRCKIFERVVLPTADMKIPDQNARLKARNAYYDLHSMNGKGWELPKYLIGKSNVHILSSPPSQPQQQAKPIRKCPDCKKRPLAYKAKYCSQCAVRRRRESNRRASKYRRSRVSSL